MLRSIKKLIGDKGRQLIVPIVLMSLDAIGSLVMYLMLYFTVVHLLSGTLSGTLVRNYTIEVDIFCAFREVQRCAVICDCSWQIITAR